MRWRWLTVVTSTGRRLQSQSQSQFLRRLFVFACFALGARILSKFAAVSVSLTDAIQSQFQVQFQSRSQFDAHENATEQGADPLLSSSALSGKYQWTWRILERPPVSRIHCIADTFSSSAESAVYRSCRYENLCCSAREGAFVEFPSEDHRRLRSMLHPSVHLSSVPRPVMLSPVGFRRDPRTWMPQTGTEERRPPRPAQQSQTNIRSSSSSPYASAPHQHQHQHQIPTSTYYMLDDNNTMVWIPIQLCLDESKKMKVRQVLFDIYLPIFTLLEIFDLRVRRISLIVFGDKIDRRDNDCFKSVYEFIDMMGIAPNDIVSIHDLQQIVPSNRGSGPSAANSFVCNAVSVSGIGAHASSEVPRPKNATGNGIPPTGIRRASNLRSFRTHLLGHMDLRDLQRATPYRVILSSLVPSNMLQSLQRAIPREHARISQMPANHTFRRQIEVLKKATVFVSLLDQDKSGAFFMPEGAVLIMLRRGESGESCDNQTAANSATEWNFWNNNALIRTHLLDGENLTRDTFAVELIVRDEVNRLQLDAQAQNVTTSAPPKQEIFAGRPVTLVRGSPPPPTQAHCLGEKIFPERIGADEFRSCHFQNLCFDLETKSFVVNPSQHSESLQRLPSAQKNYFSSIARDLDTPLERKQFNISSYYKFDGVWLSMQTHNTCNPGHVLWDSWLPLYSILEMFGLEEESLLLTRHRSRSDCPPVNQVYEAAFGFPNRTFQHESATAPPGGARHVCAAHAAMGFRWLHDHGANHHGWKPSDLANPVNVRRGPELERFRNRILRGMMGINQPAAAATTPRQPPHVVFVSRSSRQAARNVEFHQESQALQEVMPDVKVTMLDMKRLLSDNYLDSVKELATLATNTSIYVSVVGGANAAAFFLPKGATLILYGDKDMYLDFDLFNNYAHLRVHWLSLSSRTNDTQLLLQLIRDEIDACSRMI